MTEMSGVFRGQVIDTAMFPATGKIKIHIYGVGHPDSYELASILSPFGGLANMGMQALPPIGAEGFVAFERNDDDFAIWLGAVMIDHGTNLQSGDAHPVEATNERDFIIKTQYTSVTSQHLESKDNKVENIIHLNAAATVLAHIQQNSNYSYQDETYDPLSSFPANTLSLTDEEVRIKVRTSDNSADRTIFVNSDGITLQWSNDQSMTMTKDTTVLKNGSSQVVINSDGSVEVNATKIILGGTSGHAMIYETFRDFVNMFNSHIHGTPSGPSAPPTSPFTTASSGKSGVVQLD